VTEITSITLFKTTEGFELRFDGTDVPKADQRQKVPTLRDVLTVVRLHGLEMAPTPPTSVLGPPLPQGEVDELMEAQARAEAAMAPAGELAPHTADLGEHVERLREARPEFVKRPLPAQQLMIAPRPLTFPMLVRADATCIVLNEQEERTLDVLTVMPACPSWPGYEPLHIRVDRTNPIEVERDGLKLNKHLINLETVFR
jgi:hypothetical protein